MGYLTRRLKHFILETLRPVLAPLVTNLFHDLWYNRPDSWNMNKFLGVRVRQCPFDLQIYHELIFATKPRFIIQTGVDAGGSILFFATMLDIIGAPPESKIVGIDIKLSDTAKEIKHPRVVLLEGSSTSAEIIGKVSGIVPNESALVVLDSDHTCNHVYNEINAYKNFVAKGSYLVVEDTNINGHPVAPLFGPGPLEAAKKFLSETNDFSNDDKIWRRNLLSFHQGGWLYRKA